MKIKPEILVYWMISEFFLQPGNTGQAFKLSLE